VTQSGAPGEPDAVILDGPSSATSYVARLPVREWGFEHCPAIPYWADVDGDPDLAHVGATLGRLEARGKEGALAYEGLNTEYTIGGETHYGYEFLYGAPLPGMAGDGQPVTPPPNALALDVPEDFTLSWTTWGSVYQDSQDLVAPFAATLTDRVAATKSFWPTIATFGIPYNLLVISKVTTERAAELAAKFGDVWTTEGLDAAQAAGLTYEIDMSLFASLDPHTLRDGEVRFTPGTVTVLRQDPQSKTLIPIGVEVTAKGSPPRVYTVNDPAWLYALQAAKASITVWGIWLGHVYHWHIVTAAMQMNMFNQLPAGHRLWPLLQPQSQSLIDFDFALLAILWGKIAPPTPVDGYMSLLGLLDAFAEGRGFFDDDPASELAKRGVTQADFTVTKPWDAYPVVGDLLELWTITGDYVTAVVNDLYASDAEVANDAGVKAWMDASRDPDQGNINGLPDPVDTRAKLAAVLTSILYRVTVHGAGSLSPVVNPALAFVSNFPPCLQGTSMPQPGESPTTKELLDLLPHTGTIGGMATFYYTFAYSRPDLALIPSGGVNLDPYFPPSQPSCNAALVAYRTAIGGFVGEYVQAWNDALARIRGGAPGPPPLYAQGQAGQWPASIEI
jgi:hypothetical protein